MKSRLLALVLAGWFPLAIHAQPAAEAPLHLSKPPVRVELVAAVSAQLTAFRDGAWEEAYASAARSFQAVMPLENFVQLIQQKYAVVAKNTRTEFGVPSDNGVIAVVPVRIFGAGTSQPFNYLLVREGGTWKVTGVVPQARTEG